MSTTKLENDDLFKDTSHDSKNIIITKNGVRVSLSIEELLKKEREKGDLDAILENVEDEVHDQAAQSANP